MTPFTDLTAAIEEADFLARTTNEQSYAITDAGDENFHVMPLSEAKDSDRKILEIIHSYRK